MLCFEIKFKLQAVAELGQAQVKLDDIVVAEVLVKARVPATLFFGDFVLLISLNLTVCTINRKLNSNQFSLSNF